MSEDIHLSLETQGFEERKKKGLEENKANSGDGSSMDFPNLIWAVDLDQNEFENGKLYISGDVRDSDLTNFGYLSTTVNLDLDTVVSIIEYYMKKLGKLKTVLEATK